MIQAAQITSGLQALVEQIESLPPRELEDQFEAVRERAGTVRHLTIGALLAAARSLDWAPFDAGGSVDLTPATARHVETLSDRLPVAGREQLARLFALAVSHRIHVAAENAPFLLPEIAPDLERMKDPKATFEEVRGDLRAGAVTRALHGWPCCSGRTPWSAVTETLAELALADGATLGGRAIAATNLRRYLEIVGREHRHPVITALFRCLGSAPRGVAPADELTDVLSGITEIDELRDPGAGHVIDVLELTETLMDGGHPENRVVEHIRGGASLSSLMTGIALVAAERTLALEGATHELESWCAETLVAINALRDLDGHDDGWMRPRVVVEAARILGRRARVAEDRGASWSATVNLSLPADASPQALAAALMQRDRTSCVGLCSALAADPMRAAEAAQVMDTHGVAGGFDPADLGSLRTYMCAIDEYRRASGSAAGRFLAAASIAVAGRDTPIPES